MQAHLFKKFSLAKIVFYPIKKIYPLLLPSHNCIIIFIQCSVFKVHLVEIKSAISHFTQALNACLRLCFSSSIQTRLRWALNGAWVSLETQWNLSYYRNFIQSLMKWWRVPGSNRWPPACKAGALPAELTPHFGFWKWWAKMDSNHRPHDYQSCALASWAIGPF